MSFPISPAHRLYAILDVDLTFSRGLAPLEVVDAWLDAGVRLFQLRAKSMTGGPMLDLADTLAAKASKAGATFIVNDRADVAAMANADGVHVGQDDLPPAAARAIVGDGLYVGVSTHSLEQLRAAMGEPVDYLAIGPVFSTASKANPDPVVGLDTVRDAARVAPTLPLVAIGGITLDTAPGVIAAGASAVAVISNLLSSDHPRRRAKEFLSALA